MTLRRALALCCLFLLVAATIGWAQDSGAFSPSPQSNADFLQAADEVLQQMSQLLSLPVLHPLKKSVRSRDQIRDYLIQQMKEDKDPGKRYADQKVMEALGLIPKDYPLEQKMVALLTEQIAGLYDPKSGEFFIADWNSPADQRMIMAHELTHALQDQHFQIQKWEDAAKPNDDAELARDAVLEGSATVAMIDYLLRDIGKSSRDIEDLDPSLVMGDATQDPELSQAPMLLQDELLFPYFAGSTFVQRALKTWSGWPDLHKLFENPPLSTQQIMHPDLYFRGVTPVKVDLPLGKIVPAPWKKLDEDLLGEFGVNEMLKQFLGKDRADDLAAAWAGDRYEIFERQPGGPTLLLIRTRFASDDAAARFFGGYSETLELKDKDRSNLFRRPNYFSFDTPNGGVYLRCFASECLSAEGATQKMFDDLTRAMHWPAGPAAPRKGGPEQNDVALPGSRSGPVSALLSTNVSIPAAPPGP